HARNHRARFIWFAQLQDGPTLRHPHGETLQRSAASVTKDRRKSEQATAYRDARQYRGKIIALLLEHCQQRKADKDVGKLGRQLHNEINDRRDRREKSRYAGKRQRARAKDVTADLREWQHLSGAVAHQSRPDKFAGRGSREISAKRPPCKAEKDGNRKMCRNNDSKPAETQRRPGCCNGS